MASEDVYINDELTIPFDEIRFETSRSSGPGGQHVNKTESRVTLVFDLEGSTALTSEMRRKIGEAHGNRISKRGELRASAQSHRSQRANREETVERFAELLRTAIAPRAERKATRPSKRAKHQRLEEKRKHSKKKALRRAPSGDG